MDDRKVIVVTTAMHKLIKTQAMEHNTTMLELCEQIFKTYFKKVDQDDENS